MLKSVSDRIFLFDVFCENNIILGLDKFFFLVSKFYDFENVVFQDMFYLIDFFFEEYCLFIWFFFFWDIGLKYIVI